MTITFPLPLCQVIQDLDYNDTDAVMDQIHSTWWLEAETCKYMLAVLVHKDNKDISSDPTKLPAGVSREVIRTNKVAALETERVLAKKSHSIECEIDLQIKKTKIDGMRSQVEKNQVEAIISQINVMRDNAQVYQAVHGEMQYQKKIVQLMDKLPGMGGNVNVETNEEEANDSE